MEKQLKLGEKVYVVFFFYSIYLNIQTLMSICDRKVIEFLKSIYLNFLGKETFFNFKMSIFFSSFTNSLNS